MYILVACRATPSSADDAARLRQLIRAETNAVRAHDIEQLESLWIEEGTVRDANHTPDDQGDDRVWLGRDAVMTRYTSLLFYLPMEGSGPTDLDIAVHGNTAVVTATTRIGDEVSPRGEQWTFVRRDGRWQIASITFNLEPR